MNKNFAEFQRCFRQYQRLFGLTGWTVYFKYEPLETAFACIDPDLSCMVATVRLSSKLPGKDEPHKDIKRSAKHEALHLLLTRLESNGRARYITSEEIYESTEELVNKLGKLIPDVKLR